MLEKHACSPPWFTRLVRRREVGVPRDPSTTRVADLSPYSPLPAIGSRRNSEAETGAAGGAEGRPPPPPLLRQDTYVVCDPLVVKGPPKRKMVRGEAWGGRRPPQTPRTTNGGTFFTVPATSKPTQPSERQPLEWSNNKQHDPKPWSNGSVKHKTNAEAYWLQC